MWYLNDFVVIIQLYFQWILKSWFNSAGYKPDDLFWLMNCLILTSYMAVSKVCVKHGMQECIA